jgi:high-affinity K+ transport system ATPase subunit B
VALIDVSLVGVALIGIALIGLELSNNDNGNLIKEKLLLYARGPSIL